MECLFIAYNAAEAWGSCFGHQASPVFTIILSFLIIAHILVVQPICFIKVASACILEGLHTDVYHVYTIPFTLVKNKLLSTLTYSIDCMMYVTMMVGLIAHALIANKSP